MIDFGGVRNSSEAFALLALRSSGLLTGGYIASPLATPRFLVSLRTLDMLRVLNSSIIHVHV